MASTTLAVGRKLFQAGVLAVVFGAGASAGSAGYVPPNGYVPDAVAALRIAEAVLEPIYGHEDILRERPFKIELKDGVWIVTGALRPGFVGGTATIKISKSDGKILYVMHGR